MAENTTTVLKQVESWILSGSNMPFSDAVLKDSHANFHNLVYTRVNEKFAYLFADEYYYLDDNGQPKPICREPLAYSGIYYYPDGKFYDMSASLRTCFPDDEEDLASRSMPALHEQLTNRARNLVEKVVDNDKDNLSVKELTDPVLVSDFERCKKCSAEQFVHDAFVTGEPSLDDLSYHCSLIVNGQYLQEQLCLYIDTPYNLIEKAAKYYFLNNQERILYELLSNEEKVKARDALLSDPAEIASLMKLKKIIEVAKNTSAKNVTITIAREGLKPITAKIQPVYLTQKSGVYSKYSLGADACKLTKNEFTYKDILEITYRGKTLYKT